jgi:hypothetical protein
MNNIARASGYIKKQVNEDDTAYLGAVDFDTELEEALGNVDRLSATMFYRSIQRLSSTTSKDLSRKQHYNV